MSELQWAGAARTQPLPSQLYSAAQHKELDRRVAQSLAISGFELMQRAGEVAFAVLRQHWPHARRLLLACGQGNNGGDALIVAGLALQQGMEVRLLLPQSVHAYASALTGEAAQSWAWLQQQGVCQVVDVQQLQASDYDLVVDGLLGVGFRGSLRTEWVELVEAINQLRLPVLALDLPSGLEADSGRAPAGAVKATVTLTFLGLKPGLLSGQGADYCGQILFHELGAPGQVYQSLQPVAERVDSSWIQAALPKRQRTAHKGLHGHVVVVGGDLGMGGAALMAAQASLRAGAGRVTLLTRQEHVAPALMRQPEIMVQGVRNGLEAAPWLAQADVILIGPGLGQKAWGQQQLQQVLALPTAKVLDADALNLLAQQPAALSDSILTPHPGEAARLLGWSTAEVVQEPLAALAALQQRYAGVSLLKGKGTWLAQQPQRALMHAGNPGMAVAGMGDVLAGIIAGLYAQGLSAWQAACVGAQVHAEAADRVAARQGERGLLATDLLAEIQNGVNP